jgi:DNA-binding CsgD family transcriptional regulator
MATMADALDQGRRPFAREAWADVYARLSVDEQAGVLDADDFERMATAAYLIGRNGESTNALARAHDMYVSRCEPERAARCAFWLCFQFMSSGEVARGSGWLARGRRLLAECDQDCAEHGYLLVPDAIGRLARRELATALEMFTRAAAIGERLGERDLTAFGRLGQGRTLISLNRTAEGIALLDEMMLTVTGGELTPIASGVVYCAVIEACMEILDLRRAREWTNALSEWCDDHPDVVPFRGNCMVARAEILQLHGAWADAMHYTERACVQLALPAGQPGIGLAFYQLGELHRLRGDFRFAEDSYRKAAQWIRKPRPGMALLRLAEGRVDAAQAGIRRLMGEPGDARTRADVLSACAEIMTAVGDFPSARDAADELSTIAKDLDAPFLRAVAAQVEGAVLLAEDHVVRALEPLRRAWSVWQELEIPYQAARTRVLIGMACARMGDQDAVEMEFDAARCVFQHLGAVPDIARVDDLSARTHSRPTGGLSAREIQVLRLVASGTTNRAIAAELFISEKTVARHVSNIFTKLRLSSRAAATAYAFKQGLV